MRGLSSIDNLERGFCPAVLAWFCSIKKATVDQYSKMRIHQLNKQKNATAEKSCKFTRAQEVLVYQINKLCVPDGD